MQKVVGDRFARAILEIMNNPDIPLQSDLDRQALISRVAGRVREVRKQKGMPRRVVSELSGISPRYLAQLEAGEGNISIALLERVARALEMPIEALISQHISVDPEACRIGQLFERAPNDVRDAIKDLLNVNKPIRSRSGRICLIGLRGAGKTTLGRRAAEVLNVPFLELSRLVEVDIGMSQTQALSFYGAEAYRRLEVDALDQVTKRTDPLILTVSCGLVEQKEPYTRLLAQFHTVWLRTSSKEHVARVCAQGGAEPVGDEASALSQTKSLLDKRERIYSRAQAQLNTTDRPVQQSVRDLVSLIKQSNFLEQ